MPRRAGLSLAVAGILAVLPIGILVVASDGCGSTEGSLTVEGGPHGPFVFNTTGCGSLQHYGRFGAALHGEGPNDGGVYVSRDPTRGTVVEVEVPGSCRNADGTDCTVFAVPREQCTVFDVSVTPTNTSVNRVRLVEGHVRLDCALTDGTTLRGALSFGGC